MKNRNILLYFLLSAVIHSSNMFAADDDNIYDVRNIPLRLKSEAGAVIREYSVRFEILDKKTAVEKVKYAVTIFNKDNQHYGEISIWYDKFRSINDFEGIIYDADGEEIRDLEDSDVKDFSSFEDYTLYSDNRVKFLMLYYDKFPYTVEFTYEFSYNGYLNFPTWYSRSSTDPVQYSSFEVETASDFDLRFWCNRDSLNPVITDEYKKKLYKWEVRNIGKLHRNAVDEDIEDYADIVRIAPVDFEIEGFQGSMNSWKNFGLWYSQLSNNKDNLDESVLTEISTKITALSDVKEKVNTLYKYMQSRTRYVSVQLGIGGWQPYDASYVHTKGYGDCKALSNYMVSILNYSGIDAYPVLIRSGNYNKPMITDFPSNQFNHVIVCVPLGKDSIWLECTSQKMPMGSIGWSNENREALMITPEGGEVVRTPCSSPEKNIQLKNITVNLSSNGKADVKSGINWFGNQHNYVLSVLNNSSREKEKWIRNLFDVPDLTLDNYLFNDTNASLNEINLQLNFSIPRYGSASGKRIFFNPNLMEKRTYVPKEFSGRISPVRIKYPYLDIDSIIYILPENYKIEASPKETDLESSFGKFSSRIKDNGDNSLLFVRRLEIKDYSIPAENYSEYQKFFAEIVKADKQQVVLVKVE